MSGAAARTGELKEKQKENNWEEVTVDIEQTSIKYNCTKITIIYNIDVNRGQYIRRMQGILVITYCCRNKILLGKEENIRKLCLELQRGQVFLYITGQN